ncbi:hypothetical protein BcepSauron_062 [Burkholderia phage BcepSauron]|uniref:Uncharacterized protein n=1 Tax=Burkholderia phage BcepSauron TaxID=2530033 RepID=A0A482MMF7_9CAUD|nr:hypothetical protein H1O17_gp062 [Burkholderia phage BcepSauron]QBQ74442.1 hypothetical protein BcepSauron_062 [Burkholderia phage BcepSauron]
MENQVKFADDTINEFEFYAWVRGSGCMLVDSIRDQLERLDVDKFALSDALSCNQRRDQDLIGFYIGWGREYPEAWAAWLADCRRQYMGVCRFVRGLKS